LGVIVLIAGIFAVGCIVAASFVIHRVADRHKEIAKEITKSDNSKRIVVFIVLFAGLVLTGCLASPPPEPEIITRKCPMVDLRPKPTLPVAKKILPPECPFYRCYDEANYKISAEREIRLRKDSNYVRKVYKGAQELCK